MNSLRQRPSRGCVDQNLLKQFTIEFRYSRDLREVNVMTHRVRSVLFGQPSLPSESDARR